MDWWRRKQRERDLERELQSHLELEAAERAEDGLSPEQARYAAQRAFGNTTSTKEAVREMWTWRAVDQFWRDVRYAARALRKDGRFTMAAVISLALGIGANTAIFTVVNGVLLKPLPYADPTRLYSVQEAGRGHGNSTSYLDFEDWRSQNRVFSGMASYHGGDFALTGEGEPARLLGAVVSSSLLSVLGVNPILGRGFVQQDDKPGAPVALLSHSLWRTRFHADPSIVGRPIMLDREPVSVVGIMPAGFRFPPNAEGDVWVTSAIDTGSSKTQRGFNWLSVIARLKPGVTQTEAQADMDLIAQRLAQQYPRTNDTRTSVRLMPELDRIVGNTRTPLTILLAVVVGVLLIACVNVANLFIARNLVRRKEIAVRAALGANRRTLIAQLLTESVMLSTCGGLCGIALAFWSTRVFALLAPQALPRAADVTVDGRVLAFALALSLATGFLFGLAPALRISRTNLEASLREARQANSSGPQHRRLRDVLVIVQTGLAVVLTAAAVLLIASYLRLVRVDPGFDRRNLLTFDFSLADPAYTPERQLTFCNELLARLSALPSVKSAVASWPLPFSGGDPSSGFDIEGRTLAPGVSLVGRVHLVSPGYFRSLGMKVRDGRDFTDRDTLSSPQVAVVDEAFVRAYFPTENPLHKRFKPSMSMRKATPWREIVGVVNSTKEVGLAEDFQPQYYIPYAQLPGPSPQVIMKTAGDPLTLAAAIRKIVAAADGNVPVYDVRTMEELAASSIARERMNTFLFSIFGALALALAAVGIYGVANYSVSQTAHEIGIRMALGAQKRDVLSLTLHQALRNVAIGVAAGVAAVLALTRFLTGLLYGVRPADPVLLAGVCLGFAGVALCASYIPARRATKIDPASALRVE